MLLIITPNPALDRTMMIHNLRLGAVQRAEYVIVAAGGKGLNVARAAHTLGQPLCVCGPLGGLTGSYVAQLAEREGLKTHWHWHTAGETRTCVLLVDPHGSDATALNEAGPMLSDADWQQFLTSVGSVASTATLAAIAGSLPQGVPPDALAALIRLLDEAGCRTVVDCSGAALASAVAARPYAIKVNASELGATLGCTIGDIDSAVQALKELRRGGIALAVVSLGAQGAVAAAEQGIYWACPPALKIVSTIGSGDSLLAGLATGLLRGVHVAEALRLGVACGSADALTIGGGLLHLADVERIAQAIRVVQLDAHQ